MHVEKNRTEQNRLHFLGIAFRWVVYRLHWWWFVWYHSTDKHPAQLMYPLPMIRFPGIFRERENWPLCSLGRSGYRKGSFRLMTRGGDSLQAFMHHVPFTAKHVRERSHREFLGYLQSVSITFASYLLAPSTDAHRLKDGGRQKQARASGCGGWRS